MRALLYPTPAQGGNERASGPAPMRALPIHRAQARTGCECAPSPRPMRALLIHGTPVQAGCERALGPAPGAPWDSSIC